MSADQATKHEDFGARLVSWFEANRKQATWAATALVVLAGGVWFVSAYQKNKALAAAQALESARGSFQSGNLPLAASDLSRLIASYPGTAAGDEAVVLLAQIRMRQNQPQLAADELQVALGRGMSDQFRAPAFGLLGAALEDAGNPAGAATAYENAAAAAWYEFLAAEFLVGAGRAHAAGGDTVKAIAAYERVIEAYESTPAAAEARIRAAELRAATGA